MKVHDLFLHRVLRHDPVHGDGALLADAVGPVRGLVLHGGVPPGVHVDHVIGGGEVQSGPSRPEADEEAFLFSPLEGGDLPLPLPGRSGAVQVGVGHSEPVEVFADNGEMVHELAEDEAAVPPSPEFFQDLAEGLEPGGGESRLFRKDERGAAAGPPEPHELCKDHETLVPPVSAGLDLARRLPADGLVDRPLLPGHLHPQYDLRLGRKLAEHLVLGPPEEEGPDELFQARRRPLVPVLFDGHGEAPGEAVQGSEQAGVEKAEKVPQFAEVVFHRRSRGDDPEVPLQLHGGGGPFRAAVFDGLGLVEDHGVPLHRLEEGPVVLQEAVARRHHVEGAQLIQELLPVAVPVLLYRQGGGEPGRLGPPVRTDRHGGHHQGGSAGSAGKEGC